LNPWNLLRSELDLGVGRIEVQQSLRIDERQMLRVALVNPEEKIGIEVRRLKEPQAGDRLICGAGEPSGALLRGSTSLICRLDSGKANWCLRTDHTWRIDR
jgi:hypothetical protein